MVWRKADSRNRYAVRLGGYGDDDELDADDDDYMLTV